MPAARVVLWRHGRTAFNHERRFQGQLDVALDAVGETQVKAAAAELAPRLRGGGPVVLVTSDLRRAASTAAALTAETGLPAVPEPGVREVHAGVWQGLTHPEIQAAHPADFDAWRRGEDLRLGGPGGEKRSEVARRAAVAIERHAATVPDGGTLVVASHGAALKGAVLELTGLGLAHWDRLAGFRNAHWTVLEPSRRGGWVLVEHNVGAAGDEVGVEG
ncbi:histidine phosphatase family protein [Kineococcus gynurae]|uniref:Histidine phosphatase family protein n=1 Tax=Kineococcus gynurae TaxID=452979 RepID=A0ABV5LVX1_9ACTN